MLTSYKKAKSYLSVQIIILYLIYLHIKHKEKKINSCYENMNIICVNTHECYYNHSFIVYFTNTMFVCFDPRF